MKYIDYNFFTIIMYQFSILFVIISSRFSCKIEQFNKKPQKCFSLKKNKTFIKIFVPDYRLWTTETSERVPWQRWKRCGLHNLIMKLLKKWMTKCNAW